MGHLEEALEQRYNQWGMREPLVSTDDENLEARATRMASYRGLSEAASSFLEMNALTGCAGLEFVAFSNARLSRAVQMPNGVILHPCFIETGGQAVSDPMVQASMRMESVGKYLYDGWLPIASTERKLIASRVEGLRESLASFVLVSGSSFEWEPKYSVSGNHGESHHLGDDHLGTLEDIANGLAAISGEDKHAILRSVAWVSRAKSVNDNCSKFLFAVLAIESQ